MTVDEDPGTRVSEDFSGVDNTNCFVAGCPTASSSVSSWLRFFVGVRWSGTSKGKTDSESKWRIREAKSSI
jgi:hypothetical protein